MDTESILSANRLCKMVFQVFQTSTVPEFNKVFHQQALNIQMIADVHCTQPQWPSVTSVAKLATNTHRCLRQSRVWNRATKAPPGAFQASTHALTSAMTPVPAPCLPRATPTTLTGRTLRCFNCSSDHLLRECTLPHDQACINAAWQQVFSAQQARLPSTCMSGGWPQVLNHNVVYVLDTACWREMASDNFNPTLTLTLTSTSSNVPRSWGPAPAPAPVKPCDNLLGPIGFTLCPGPGFLTSMGVLFHLDELLSLSSHALQYTWNYMTAYYLPQCYLPMLPSLLRLLPIACDGGRWGWLWLILLSFILLITPAILAVKHASPILCMAIPNYAPTLPTSHSICTWYLVHRILYHVTYLIWYVLDMQTNTTLPSLQWATWPATTLNSTTLTLAKQYVGWDFD